MKFENMTAETLRPVLRNLKENRRHLIAAHQNNSSPADTVAELVNLIGYPATLDTVAELVNGVGEWDGRISRRCREWAQTIDTAATRSELERFAVYAPSEIHPAHIDQIAAAMMEYTPEAPADDQQTDTEKMPRCEDCAKVENCARDTGFMFGGCRSEFVPADPVAAVFPALVAEVNAEADRRHKENRFFIENGFCTHWAEYHRTPSDEGLRRYSTPAKWEAYQAGSLSREKAVEIAAKRSGKEVERWREKQLGKLRAAAVAPDLVSLSVGVEWAKSRTWGANPTATARTPDSVFEGHASGCGYDKESAAVGEALNQSPAVLRVLYMAAENALRSGQKPRREGLASGCVDWRDLLGYGSGYGILPYFEGGVGVSCFWSILSRCGFECRRSASGKMFDSYTAERKGA